MKITDSELVSAEGYHVKLAPVGRGEFPYVGHGTEAVR